MSSGEMHPLRTMTARRAEPSTSGADKKIWQCALRISPSTRLSGRTRASCIRATSQGRAATSDQPASREDTLTERTTGPGPGQAASPMRTCRRLPAWAPPAGQLSSTRAGGASAAGDHSGPTRQRVTNHPIDGGIGQRRAPTRAVPNQGCAKMDKMQATANKRIRRGG